MPERIDPVGFAETYQEHNTLGSSPLEAFGAIECQADEVKTLTLIRNQALDSDDLAEAQRAQILLDRLHIVR